MSKPIFVCVKAAWGSTVDSRACMASVSSYGLQVSVWCEQGRGLLQSRCFADTAVSTQLKEPDWEAFGAIVTSDEGKRELATLRSQFAEIKTRLTTQSQVIMALDVRMNCTVLVQSSCQCGSGHPDVARAALGDALMHHTGTSGSQVGSIQGCGACGA